MNGLKTKTNAGRPNWDKIFRKLQVRISQPLLYINSVYFCLYSISRYSFHDFLLLCGFLMKKFFQFQEQNKGKVTVFYCGNPAVAKILRSKCEEFQFDFRKEVF